MKRGYKTSLRITGGTLRGRLFASADASDLRPTSDRVRQALFNALGSRMTLEGVDVLELFAGTGALGIEAISRGAATATFVERNPATARLIRDNLTGLDIMPRGTVVTEDAMKFIQSTSLRFHLILADPPYALAVFHELVGLVFQQGLLHANGILAVEHQAFQDSPKAPDATTITFRRSFGDTALTFYSTAQYAIT